MYVIEVNLETAFEVTLVSLLLVASDFTHFFVQFSSVPCSCMNLVLAGAQKKEKELLT